MDVNSSVKGNNGYQVVGIAFSKAGATDQVRIFKMMRCKTKVVRNCGIHSIRAK